MPDIHEQDRSASGKKSKPTERERVMGELDAAREALRHKKDVKPEPEAPKYIAKHKVVAGDTMSGLALKYYGSAVRDKWMHIYEANKELIGDNPAFIKVGQVLNIPEPPK
ncbi:MAG: LysM peptidoglycan-binding domain-containing protein [Candidatus Promineifilaceae bacterium]